MEDNMFERLLAGRSKSERVRIFDRHADSRTFYVRFLSHAGYTVEAHQPHELITSNLSDASLVILDDPALVLDARRVGAVNVAVLTTYPAQNCQDLCGLVAFLLKPVPLQQLALLVAEFADESRSDLPLSA